MPLPRFLTGIATGLRRYLTRADSHNSSSSPASALVSILVPQWLAEWTRSLKASSFDELVAASCSRNGFQRKAAVRLLAHRVSPAARPARPEIG